MEDTALPGSARLYARWPQPRNNKPRRPVTFINWGCANFITTYWAQPSEMEVGYMTLTWERRLAPRRSALLGSFGQVSALLLSSGFRIVGE